MNHSRSFLPLPVLVSMLAVAPLAIGASVSRAEDVPGVTATEINFGNQSQQTGQFSLYGLQARTMKAYFEMINEGGGIFGRKINFNIGDSGGNSQQALQVIRKQVEKDNVFGILAGQGFAHLAVYKYLRQKKVPDLFITDGTLAYSEPVASTTFGYSPLLRDDAKFFAEYVLKHFPGKKIGILSPDTANGKEAVDAFVKAIGGKSKVASIEEVSVDATNANAQVLNLKNAGVEVVYTATRLPMTPVIMKFAHEQGYHPQWFLMYYNCNNSMLDLTGKDAVEGAISWYYLYSEAALDQPGVKKHFEFMKKRLPNEKAGSLSLSGQAIAELAVEALKRAGKDLTREGLIKAVEGIKNFQCTVCPVPNSFGPDKHLFITEISPSRAHNGQWIPLKD